MIRLLEDLRFCIGAFFAIVGTLLSAHGLMVGTIVAGCNINLWAGVVFLVFGGASLILALRDSKP